MLFKYIYIHTYIYTHKREASKLACPVKEKPRWKGKNVPGVYTGAICPPKWSPSALTQKDTKQADWLNQLLNWADSPYKINWVHRLQKFVLSSSQLLSTRGSQCCFRELWSREPQDNNWSQQLLESCPNIPWSRLASQEQQGSWLAKPNCYQVQAPSVRCITRQWIPETSCWSKEGTLIGEPAGQEDGRLSPQNYHLVRAWLPGSFMDLRWKGGGGGWGNKSKETIQSLQMSPKMDSLSQVGGSGCKPLWMFTTTKSVKVIETDPSVNLKISPSRLHLFSLGNILTVLPWLIPQVRTNPLDEAVPTTPWGFPPGVIPGLTWGSTALL